MRVRITCSRLEPALPSASPIRSRHSLACAYGPAGGGDPSAAIGAVPATRTRSPHTTAREKPNTPSYGECPLTRRSSTLPEPICLMITKPFGCYTFAIMPGWPRAAGPRAVAGWRVPGGGPWPGGEPGPSGGVLGGEPGPLAGRRRAGPGPFHHL